MPQCSQAEALCYLYSDSAPARQSSFSVKELLDQIIENTGYVKELKAEGTEEAIGRILKI